MCTSERYNIHFGTVLENDYKKTYQNAYQRRNFSKRFSIFFYLMVTIMKNPIGKKPNNMPDINNVIFLLKLSFDV